MLAAFIALLTPATTVSAADAPAQDRSSTAVATPPSCPTGLVCAWTGPDFTGHLVLIAPSELRTCWVAESGVVRSVWNATASTVLVWASPYCWGIYGVVIAGTGRNTPFPVQSIS